MANIDDLLEQIQSAIYGKEVRGAIHDAIQQCYEDTETYRRITSTIAPTFDTSVPYAAGDYAWYYGTLYHFKHNHAAGEWSWNDVELAYIGEDIGDLENVVWQYNMPNCRNLLNDYSIASGTQYGVTCTYNTDGSVTFSGTNAHPGGGDLAFFYLEPSAIPSDLEKGGYYRCQMDSSVVAMIILWHSVLSQSPVQINEVTSESIVHVPESANYCTIYLRVSNGSTVNETVHPVIFVPIGTKELSGELEELKSQITEQTQNIWTFGNQSFVKKTGINNANIPAGTYTISAEVLRESTADVNLNARMVFYKESVATVNVLANPALLVNSGRQSAIFSLSEKADIIVIYSSVNESQSVDVDALWKNVQLETGATASDYVPPITGVDFEARNTLNNDAIRADIVQSLTTTAKEQAQTNIGLRDAIRADIVQSLTTTAKEQAQTNIGLRNATRNLWTAGDQTFTKQKDIPVNLVPGDYVLSATVVSVKNNQEANNYNARIEITTISDGTLVLSIDRNYRAAILFNLPSAATNIRLYASNTGSNSSDTTSTWTNIQLEKSTFQTPYIAPYMPYDEKVIPNDDVLLSAENLTITLSQWRFETIRKNIDLRNVIIECDAKWTGNEADEYHVPEARFFYSTGDQGTGYYNIGEKGFYKNSQWRLPPFPNYTGEYANKLTLEFRIPSGLTLYIRKLVVRYDDSQTRFGAGLMIHTHGSFMFYPQHSLPALWGAAKCGATHFVTIPKRAEVLENGGGEWFCYHDDTFVESTTILRTSDGQQITNSGYNNKPFSEIPWSWLKTLDSGIYKDSQFAGTRPMLVEEMLAVCAKTGVHPVFSWHPWSSQADVQNFRELLEKYDMVGKTTILPSNSFFTESAYPVFGNDLEMYKFGPTMGSATAQTVQAIIDLINGTSGLDKNKCCIALWITDSTDELVDMIRNAGIKVGLHQYSHTSPSGRTAEAFSGGDYLYWMKRGVTVFTDNHNSSIGLNW